MTDLEICKRIAEIEGLSPFIDSIYPSTSSMAVFVPIDVDTDSVYDPLSGDICSKALCFDLMVKYKISIDFEDDLCGVLTIIGGSNQWEYLGNTTIDNGNPQRAICLAIIEANKEYKELNHE